MQCAPRMSRVMRACLALSWSGFGPLALQASPPTLYLADFEFDRIHAVDWKTGALIGSFPAPGAFSTGLELAAGDLYVNNHTGCSDDRIYRIHPQTGSVLGSYPSPACPIDGLASDPSGAYLIGLAILPTPQHLVVLDRNQGTIVTTIVLDLKNDAARGLTWLGDLVYVSDEATETIYAYSINISQGLATRVAAIPIGARCPGLADDDDMLIAYDIAAHQLLEIDPVSGAVTPRPLPGGIGQVAGLAFEASGCYPDCSVDGVLTVADFGCFQTKFVAGDPYADCNTDGSLTVADFGCFQTRFVAGCP